MDLITIKLTGLLYSRIQTKVSIKLLWGRKQIKIPHFGHQDNGT